MKAMLLTKLKVAAWVLLLAVCIGTGAAYRATARELRQAADGPQVARSVENELEALRLEIEALRKGLQATRERVKALESQVEALRPMSSSGSSTTSSNSGSSTTSSNSSSSTRPTSEKPGQSRTVPSKQQSYNSPMQLLGTIKGEFSPNGADLLANADAALKQLRQNPNDKAAAGALEQALKSLTVSRERVKDLEGRLQGQSTALREEAVLSLILVPTHDPLAGAEAAIKKLRQNPKDRQATEALEQALKRLKEQRAPNKPTQLEKPGSSRRER
jgi:hypothetical protein